MHGPQIMPGIVKGWPQEVIHRSIDNDEVALTAGLQIQHPRQQCAGIAGETAARLEYQRFGAPPKDVRSHRRVVGECGRRLVAIADAEAAAQIDMLELDTLGDELLNER